MKAEIIIIGDEIVSGGKRDLNGWYASNRLISCGIGVRNITVVGDNYESVLNALSQAVKRSDFIIVTGGLGPTEDDLTTEAASRALKRPLFLDRNVLDRLKKKMDKSGIVSSDSLEKLAWLPEGAKMLDPNGEVCGYYFYEGDRCLYFLPGVPEQMRRLMERRVLPDMLRIYKPASIPFQRTLKLYGLSETYISDTVKGLKDELEGVVFGFYPSFPENHLTVTTTGKGEKDIEGKLGLAEEKIRNILGAYIFTSEDKSMEEVVGELMEKNRMTISIAESCTGGLLGHRLTSIPGSSEYFERGVIVYSNKSKMEILGVKQRTLDNYGAVSEQAAREMAEGIRRTSNTDLGLAVTGIAGPSGGTEEKPVGTVFLGLSVNGNTYSGGYSFEGSRGKVKSNSSEMALDWVRRHINGYPFIPGI